MNAQIIAMGGGGFSSETGASALDRYVLAQSTQQHPKVCFLAQASGEAQPYIDKFYSAFSQYLCQPSHLSLLNPPTDNLPEYLLQQDVIYVGGGNTEHLLAVWRVSGLHIHLRRAYENGTILAGISAGANCWFEQSVTDVDDGGYAIVGGLGYLTGSCTSHYSSEVGLRPACHQMIAENRLKSGYTFDDFAAGHFINGQLHRCVCSRSEAQAYFLENKNGSVHETLLKILHLTQ
jgi:dipeptidase E